MQGSVCRAAVRVKRAVARYDAPVLMAALIDFIEDHRAHGTLTADATEATDQGYMLTVACSCGVAFMRWITETEAVSDLVTSRLLVEPN